jgi:hypothetical protein
VFLIAHWLELKEHSVINHFGRVFLLRPVCFHITRTHKAVKSSQYDFSVLALNSKMMDYKRGEKKPYGKK